VLVEDLHQALDLYRILKSRVGTDLLHYEFAKTALDKPTEDDQRRVDSEVSSTSSPEDIEQRRQELEERARQTGDPHKRSRLIRAIERNPVFATFTKEAAGYVCAGCGAPGFAKVRGGKYAEAQHLALGGADAPSNMICVCPTCHAILHYGSDQALLERALPAFASQVLSWR
jgi:predicted HNH restriction endonuclease